MSRIAPPFAALASDTALARAASDARVLRALLRPLGPLQRPGVSLSVTGPEVLLTCRSAGGMETSHTLRVNVYGQWRTATGGSFPCLNDLLSDVVDEWAEDAGGPAAVATPPPEFSPVVTLPHMAVGFYGEAMVLQHNFTKQCAYVDGRV
jgi:hypothetical protein